MANILLVEDDPLVRETLSTAIRTKGHSVVAASNGLEGLKHFEQGRFDLVITDIIMPDMEGIGMIMQLLSKAPETKIIAISGGGRTGGHEFLTMAERLGAAAVMKKPIRLADLHALLSKYLDRQPAGTATVSHGRAAAGTQAGAHRNVSRSLGLTASPRRGPFGRDHSRRRRRRAARNYPPAEAGRTTFRIVRLRTIGHRFFRLLPMSLFRGGYLNAFSTIGAAT